MDIQRFKELTPQVSNQTIAGALRKTAAMLSNLGKQIGATDDSVSVVVMEAAKRLESMPNHISSHVEALKQLEDLNKRVIDTITPENIALGHSWLRRKLTEVIAAN